MNKVWYVHTMDYYTTVKTDETVSIETTLMGLEGIMPHGIIRLTKTDNHMILLMNGI